jgi:hypothetical protein
MDDLHDRCQRLESLLQSLDPSIDLEDLLGGRISFSPPININTTIVAASNVTRYGHDRSPSSGTESSGMASPDNRSECEEVVVTQLKYEAADLPIPQRGAAVVEAIASLNIELPQHDKCPNTPQSVFSNPDTTTGFNCNGNDIELGFHQPFAGGSPELVSSVDAYATTFPTPPEVDRLFAEDGILGQLQFIENTLAPHPMDMLFWSGGGVESSATSSIYCGSANLELGNIGRFAEISEIDRCLRGRPGGYQFDGGVC